MHRFVILSGLLLLGSWTMASEPGRISTLDRAGRPYLLLDPSRATLELWLEGHLLATWPVQHLESAERRDLLGRRPDGSWVRDVWSRGRVQPACRRDQVELDVTRPDYEDRRKAALVPPSPEEECPSPARWWITFADRRSLEIIIAASPEQKSGPSRLWFAFLRGRGSDRVRVQLRMHPTDAGTLYRSVPDSVSFTVKD